MHFNDSYLQSVHASKQKQDRSFANQRPANVPQASEGRRNSNQRTKHKSQPKHSSNYQSQLHSDKTQNDMSDPQE